jgi:hypothetical protein
MCLADRPPQHGWHQVGAAGTDDVKVWHVIELYWNGKEWLRRDGSNIAHSLLKPDRTFYRKTFYQGDAP